MPKRKRESLEDDDGPMLGRQILPVANLPDDFSGVPANGMEYLFTVRRNARTLPHITRAVNPYEVPEEPLVTQQSHLTRQRHPLLPTDEWRMLFEKRFRNFRKNITQPTIYVDLTPQQASWQVIPDKTERDHWWGFIAGEPEVQWNRPKMSKKRKNAQSMRIPDDDQEHGTQTAQETWRVNDEGEVELALRVDPTESLPTPSGSPGPSSPADGGQCSPDQQVTDGEQEGSSHGAREPTPGVMKLMDNRMCLQLLKYFTYWINAHVQNPEVRASWITEVHARWIFALLSRVEDTISAGDTNLLRNLARAALGLLERRLIQKRRGVNATPDTIPGVVPMSESSCWLIVTAVVGGWGQRDIWTDAEQMLARID